MEQTSVTIDQRVHSFIKGKKTFFEYKRIPLMQQKKCKMHGESLNLSFCVIAVPKLPKNTIMSPKVVNWFT